jgi:Fur family ferric uptake transcriptional regulator
MTDAERPRAAGLRVAPAARREPAARQEPGVGGGHPHIVCRRCGAVADCTLEQPPYLQAASSTGFVIDGADVTFRGLCPRCQTAAGPGG